MMVTDEGLLENNIANGGNSHYRYCSTSNKNINRSLKRMLAARQDMLETEPKIPCIIPGTLYSVWVVYTRQNCVG